MHTCVCVFSHISYYYSGYLHSCCCHSCFYCYFCLLFFCVFPLLFLLFVWGWYLDDKYDYSTGTFTGMTDETKQIFLKDLKTFYTAFTGKQDMDENITKFSDIKLKDYNSMEGCQGANPKYKVPITLNKNDKLFVKYAENIKTMLKTTKERRLSQI